jgi:hypothetical protein
VTLSGQKLNALLSDDLDALVSVLHELKRRGGGRS